MRTTGQAARIAVDIGGTFTDVVLESGGDRTTVKVLTTPDAPDEGVLCGIDDVLTRGGVDPARVEVVIHGTTLATNAILERKGALTALLTTDGFRDVLEIGYESRYDQYDVMIVKPEPLVPRERRFTVRERVAVDGRVLLPLDEAALPALVPRLEAAGVESLAIAFLHAYANPDHEQRAAELLARALPALTLTLSSEVCPEVREFERFTTASANAYVRPLMESYLGRLERRLRGRGLACALLLMTSGGGLTTIDTARRFPIRLVESGPAGGAILATHVAAELGLPRALAFDMGGTTAKICLIDGFRPRTAREFEVDRAARFTKGSGLPLRIPVIEMVEIGAGGGSIARVDAMGRIAIGPDSAGADPGPAAYARGGERPTVTDADVVLGRIDPKHFAGGRVALAPERALDAIARDVARALDVDVGMAAYGITEMVDETMANAARVHAVERGRATSDYALVAFGGAAPLHVGRLADKLGIDTIVVPADAGVGSAVGFLRAPIAYELVRSRNMRLDRLDAQLANSIIAAMRGEALAVVSAGAPGAEIEETRGAYMRYVGQGHEIFVPLPLRPLSADDAPVIQRAFDAVYSRLYRRIIPDGTVEILTFAVAVSTRHRLPEAVSQPPPQAGIAAFGERDVLDVESLRTVGVPLYLRAALPEGAAIDGPAVIAEEQTSTFVGRDFAARVTRGGHLLIERASSRPRGDVHP